METARPRTVTVAMVACVAKRGAAMARSRMRTLVLPRLANAVSASATEAKNGCRMVASLADAVSRVASREACRGGCGGGSCLGADSLAASRWTLIETDGDY